MDQTKVLPKGEIEKYVSMSCPKADITLTLFPDSNFDVTVLYWDSVTQKHTGQESITGKWHKEGNSLYLYNSDGNEEDYGLTTTKMQIGPNKVEVMTYKPIAGDKEGFWMKYDLLDQKETDKFLMQSPK